MGYKAPTIFTEDSERIQFQGVMPISDSANKLERSYGANADFNYTTTFADDRLRFSLNQLFFYTYLSHPLLLEAVDEGRYAFFNTGKTEAGCDEVVFHRGDRVTEGAHSGLAILKDGVFCTPPADELILPSITRLHFLQLCEQLGIPSRIAPFTVDELLGADEIMILSTGSHCIAVSHVDNQPVGGKDSALLNRLQQAYQDRFMQETEK